MNIDIEYINERDVNKNWFLIQKWKIKDEKINVKEIRFNYKNKSYLAVYPLNHTEEKSPLTVKETKGKKTYETNFKTKFLNDFNQSKLEKLLKKIKIK